MVREVLFLKMALEHRPAESERMGKRERKGERKENVPREFLWAVYFWQNKQYIETNWYSFIFEKHQ